MSVVGSLYTGASGLTAQGEAISVVGDNIANANTIGFKSSRANFEDVLAQSVGGGSKDIGLGARLSSVQKLLTQGSMLGTGVATDLAIKGDGFFAVKGQASGLEGLFYSRAGQFKMDQDGYLVNDGGLKLQGYNVNSSGTLVKSVTDIKIDSNQIPPVATTTSEIAGNLNSDTTALSSTTNPWDAQNPEDSSNFSTSMTVYDSLGKAHSITVFFRKSDTNPANWDFHALASGSEIQGATSNWVEIGSGTLTFDNTGALTAGGTGSITAGGGNNFIGAADQTISMDLTGVTNYASKSTVTYMDQNGYGSGSLSGINISSDGTIAGVFSNGQQRTVGQVLLADFKSPESLQRIGGNLFVETQDSGTALIGEAASGGRGVISSGMLEQSNVDLAQQFVDMIAFQRGFQSNSKIVQTADMMLQELINLKR